MARYGTAYDKRDKLSKEKKGKADTDSFPNKL